MAGRASDPAGRRLRNFVLLVIFAVALPSLVLTGFGLIAIQNERDAAVRRVHELYEPVTRRVADELRRRLEKMRQDSRVPLEDLAAWAQRKTTEPGRRFDSFFDDNRGLAAIWFVLDPSGAPLLPRAGRPLATWQGYMPEGFDRARQTEFERGKPADAASSYHAMLDELPPRHQARCRLLQALGRSLERAGQPAPALEAWTTLTASCIEHVDPAGYNPALGGWVRRLRLLQAEGSSGFTDEVLRLCRVLSAPTLEASPAQVRLVAEKVSALLDPPDAGDHRLGHARAWLQAIARRGDALAVLARVRGDFGAQPVLFAARVGGRREVFLVRGGETLSGCELVPGGLDTEVDELLRTMEIDDSIAGRVVSTGTVAGAGAADPERPPAGTVAGSPPDGAGLVAGSHLMQQTELAWRLELVLRGGDALDRLADSRTRLYFWALLLVVAALVIGIGRTVVSMVREARLSRLKTDFVSSVSHELRTPLTSIRMFTETLLLGRVRGEEDTRECLETIGHETERLSRLVERILDFSRMEAGRKAFRFRPEPVAELVEQAVAACRPMIEEGGFTVSVELDDDLPQAEVDRDAMVEVIINLVSNAVKYSPQEKSVTISARREGDRLAIAVADRGIGIPRAEHKRVFEKFYRVDIPLASEVPGSGLGLSLVQYIVRAHAGSIDLDSVAGRGSTFTVRIPFRHEEDKT